MLLDLSDISMDSHWIKAALLIENENSFFSFFCFHSFPENIPAWKPCAWQTINACQRTMGCVCSPMRDTEWGQVASMAILFDMHSEGILFALYLTQRGCRERWEDVCEIHHTAACLAQWSVTPLYPEPLLHFLIAPSQSSARGPFVYSSLQWSTPVIPVTGSMTLWQAQT